MAKFYRRGTKLWCRDPVTGLRKSTGCTNRKAAEAWYARREWLAADPRHAAAHEATLGAWAAKVLQAKRESKAAGTAAMYGVELGHVVRLLGADTSMTEVTPDRVDWYVQVRQGEGASNNTIGKELVCLTQLARHAARSGQFVGDPKALRPIGFSLEYVPRDRVLTDGEVELLRRGMPADRFAGVAYILTTSARDSEMRRARAEDYDAAERLVHLHGTKTRRSNRHVPILDWNLGLFEQALPHLPFAESGIAKSLAYWTKKLGLRHASPNDLRRTCATRLVAHGVSFDVAATIMGHVGTGMLRLVYAKLSGIQLRDLATAQSCGTETSQSTVAPPGLEPGNPHGRGILKPRAWVSSTADTAKTPGKALRDVPPSAAQSGRFGTNQSHLASLLVRLEALALIDPKEAGPGLALARAARAAMRPGGQREVERLLAQAAELLSEGVAA
jgi:integrase